MEQTQSQTKVGSPRLTLIRTAYLKDQIVRIDAPQIILAGRSNVGKSSLINNLAGRKGLARISSTPGKTRSINFYSVDPDGFYLVDLPGYGFAQCSKKEREAWAVLIKQYMAGNDRLAAVCVLLDCRLTPQRLDLELVSFVRASSIPLVPVLTKADKCKLGERAARQREWSGLLEGAEPVIFSSKTGLGRDKLWERLRRAAGPSGDEMKAD